MTPSITSIQLDINGGTWFAAIFRGDKHPRPTCFGMRGDFTHANYSPTMSSAIRVQRVQVELAKRQQAAAQTQAAEEKAK